jgi:uncharacterized protein DUF5994
MRVATHGEGMTTISLTPPSTPRLRMQSTGASRTLLDGGWWPRSTDPVAELPGLVLAIDGVHGPVTELVLSAEGWDSHPRRVGINGRVLRMGYFNSQPPSLLTALCANGKRVDLLVVAPDTVAGTADTAMDLAATSANLLHAEHIIPTLGTTIPSPSLGVDGAEQVWDTEGGRPPRLSPHPPAVPAPASARPTRPSPDPSLDLTSPQRADAGAPAPPVHDRLACDDDCR